MKKVKRFLAVILAAAMALALLSACSSSNDGGNPGANNTPGTSNNANTNDTPNNNDNSNTGDTSDSAGSGVGSGTTAANATAANVTTAVLDSINVGVQSDPADFAPWAANSNGRTNALWGIYQELGHFIDNVYTPGLMKEYTISDDGTYMDCVLFDYITDSAGNHMTANDIKFSFDTGVALGYITGVGMIDSIEVTGDYTFRFNFNKELRLGDLDTIFRIDCVTQAAYEADPNGMSSNPVGTGPYVLTSYTPNNSFTYTAREDFWQTDPQYQAARDMANVKQINYYVLAESSQRTMALEQGIIDMCSEVSNEDVDEFREGGSQSANYWTYGVPDNLSCLIFANCDSSRITSDVNLRTAIFYAIDANAILQAVWKGNGTTVHSMSPAWGTGYPAACDSQDNYYNHSVDKAKEYLEKSSYSGETLILLTESTGNVATATQMIQGFLSAAGIKSEIKSVDSTVLQATYTDPSEWDILMTQNACNVYSVTSFNPFSSDRYTTGTINHIHDDKLQELLNTAYTLSTSGDDSFMALHNYVIENAYGMNLVNYTTTYVAPKAMNTICLSYKKSFIPGGCLYNEQ